MDYIIPICIGASLPWMSQFLYSKVCQFNELQKMVSSENPSLDCSSIKGFIESTCKSARILKTSLEVMIHQKMYSPEKVELSWSQSTGHSKNSKFVYIYHNMKWYKVPFVIKRGPLQREITAIRDEAGVDVTSDILPFAGPGQDFFGSGITPQFFGLNKMTILSEGEEYIFSAETPIVFSHDNLASPNFSDEDFSLPVHDIVLPISQPISSQQENYLRDSIMFSRLE
ncbi:MAG: hypothetical protein PHG66_00760 [Candidatus Colwellbacteria bacterium]|nr:hypothetical protein [Candidatus Colwellbacteria bacterium]